MCEKNIHQDSLEEQRKRWSEISGEEITLEDVNEINQNLFNFFSILEEWNREEKASKEDG